MDLDVIAINFKFMLVGLALTFQLALITMAVGLRVGIILVPSTPGRRFKIHF